jgi:hypothetical protein
MPDFASPDWAAQLAAALEQSAAVRTESVTWVHGPVVLEIDADPEHGSAATALRLDLHEGAIRAVEVVRTHGRVTGPFSIGGTPARWRAALQGELHVTDAILDSRLRATGDLPTLVRHRAMFDAIAAAASSIDTTWADQQPTPA